jgi:hypothetical protein
MKALKIFFVWGSGIFLVLGGLLFSFSVLRPAIHPLIVGTSFEITCQGTEPKERIFLSRPTDSTDIHIKVGDETDILRQVDTLVEFPPEFSESADVFQGARYSLRYDPEFWVQRGTEVIASSCS